MSTARTCKRPKCGHEKKISPDRFTKRSRPVKRSDNWENDGIQFPRLIAEAYAAGVFTLDVLKTMAESMDLAVDQIMTIVNRAEKCLGKDQSSHG